MVDSSLLSSHSNPYANLYQTVQWYTKVLPEAIAEIGHMLVVMYPWDTPFFLNRSWWVFLFTCRYPNTHIPYLFRTPPFITCRCLWELYCSTISPQITTTPDLQLPPPQIGNGGKSAQTPIMPVRLTIQMSSKQKVLVPSL